MESQRVVGTSAHPLPSCWDDGRADFIQECSNAKNIEKFWNHAFSIPRETWLKESEEYSEYK